MLSRTTSKDSHTSGYPLGRRKWSGTTDWAFEFGDAGREDMLVVFSVRAKLVSLGVPAPLGVTASDMA